MDHIYLWEIPQWYLYFYLHDAELPLRQFRGMFAAALAEKQKRSVTLNYYVNPTRHHSEMPNPSALLLDDIEFRILES
jgi:hypothetical protein